MITLDRAVASAAIDCRRCRELLERFAEARVRFEPPDRIDAGTGVAYAVTRHFGGDAARERETCPDCGRSVDVREHRNVCEAWMRLDRPVVA